ncbi:MAG: hypothetical protein KJZ80_09750 [Hyphomicrobiaceae bacterium]|nr:hypothetical protein [Hyphomicrobiaceae bacterium]
MFSARLLGVATAIAAILGFTPVSVAAPLKGGSPKLQRNGTINIAGRDLRCGNARNVLDRRLPSEGAAAPGMLIINPRLITRMPRTVRLFIFHHECGHHNIGASELRADTWAVERGVREGWLDRNGLKQVCRSFGNMPATPTHPSGRSRCRNLERSYAQALAKLPKRKPAEEAKEAAAPAGGKPTLVSGPSLVGTGQTDNAAEDKAAAAKRSGAPGRAVR